jgi:uncharacterized membrane protein
MFYELRFALSTVAMLTCAVFTFPVALTAGLNVAQKIGLVECVTPQVQNTK